MWSRPVAAFVVFAHRQDFELVGASAQILLGLPIGVHLALGALAISFARRRALGLGLALVAHFGHASTSAWCRAAHWL
jgi:hypothetical protein